MRAWLHDSTSHGPSHLFVSAIWFLWCMRNAYVLGGERWSDDHVLSLIYSLTDDIRRCFPNRELHFTSTSSVFWIEPATGMLKLNVDGSVFASLSRAGVGGIIRDHSGSWIAGFSGFVTSCDILQVEILAILHGLAFAWRIGTRNLICETDSLEAFRAVTTPSFHPRHSCAAILHQVHLMLKRDWTVTFSHVLRSGNTSADYLARHGAISGTGFVEWDSPNRALQLLLQRDSH